MKPALPVARWDETTRRGSFESFYAAYGLKGRAEFLEAVKSPVLMTAVSTDSQTWARTLVLLVESSVRAQIAITAEGAQADLDSVAGRVNVGRAEDNDIIVPIGTVSKRHAYFAKRDGLWTITDLGSANGTVVDGRRLERNRQMKLRTSALPSIEFGSEARFVFMTPERVFEFLQEIKKTRGEAVERPPVPTFGGGAADPDDLAAVASALPDVDPEVSATNLGQTTEKLVIYKGKTPEEADAIQFEYALRSLVSLGHLMDLVEVELEGGKLEKLYGPATGMTLDACRARIIALRRKIKRIAARMVIGDKKPVDIYVKR